MARKNVLTSAKKKKAAALIQAQQLQQAKELYQQVCKTDPIDADAWFMLGAVYGRLGQPNEAVACCRRAITLEPDHWQAHYNLATALKDSGQLEDAVAAYREALRCKPDNAGTWDGLGFAFMTLGRLDEAIAAYRQVVRHQNRSPSAHANLGASLHARGYLEEAVAAYQEALRLEPCNAGILDSLACLLSNQGRYEEAVANHRRALSMTPGLSTAHSNLLLTLHYSPTPDAEEIFAEHKRWAQIHAKSPARKDHDNTRDVQRCLRVGYVSSDFRAHSVAFFIEPVLAGYDRGRIETTCYSGVTTPDATTRRLRRMAAQWREVGHMNDEQLAQTIREDRIDILVDLAGHTPGNRLKVFACKPAPVQVTYLGYPDTTGLNAMDYRLTDAVADPEHAQTYCTEKLWRLPGGFLCYQPLQDCPAVSPLPAKSNGYVTFGSFNNLAKINPKVIDLWARLLDKVPGARLFIKNPSFTDPATRERYYGLFGQRGVGRDRLELRGRADTQAEHLALYARVDIALDTFPYNGTTTSCEALWMGVPVISLMGHAHAGRVGASLLSATGLSELIADSYEGYIARATTLASDVNGLAEWRASMRERLRVSTLCDADGFTQKLENAYRDMWRQWCGGHI